MRLPREIGPIHFVGIGGIGMDGSAAAFIAAIDQAGIVTQPAQRRFIQVLKPISVKIGDSFGEIRPYANGFRAEVEIDFTNPVIGQQSYSFELSTERFRREVGRARTFGLMCDVARLWSAGYALGASFDNTVVFDEERLLNTEGLRYADECARHKVLDVIGDLALAGLPLLGAYRSVRGGHKLNHGAGDIGGAVFILRAGIDQQEIARRDAPVALAGDAVMHDGAVRPRSGDGRERHVLQRAGVAPEGLQRLDGVDLGELAASGLPVDPGEEACQRHGVADMN